MFEKTIKKGIIEIKGTKFQYEIYYSPIEHSDSTKEAIINKYGSRLHNGQICLGITKSIVRETMNNNDYHVLGFVKNTTQEDEASGALQHWDWCNTGEKQLWIGDLCRSTTVVPKPAVSPVEALLELFSTIAKTNNLRQIHLMVQDDNGPNMAALPKIYKKYGFNESSETCNFDGFMVMAKDLVKVGGTRRNRKRKYKHNTRRI
jgi:hypothetical protein